MKVTCAEGHTFTAPVVVVGRPLPVITCWACVAGAQKIPAGDRWAELDRWLRSSDAATFVDECVLGGMPAYEVDELLTDYDITPTPEKRRQFGYLVDAAIREGC